MKFVLVCSLRPALYIQLLKYFFGETFMLAEGYFTLWAETGIYLGQ
jgi:hypothetical protein